jgi:DNA-binding transcriptional ArsR family regulator
MVYLSSQLDATFAALADPTRREILARLSSGDKTISELATRFDMSLPAVSKHIRVLERAGLASVRREGRTRRTRITAAPMRPALEWIERYRAFWTFQLDQLAAYLEGPSSSETEPWQHQTQPPAPELPIDQTPARRSSSGARSAPRGNASSTRGRNRKK